MRSLRKKRRLRKKLVRQRRNACMPDQGRPCYFITKGTVPDNECMIREMLFYKAVEEHLLCVQMKIAGKTVDGDGERSSGLLLYKRLHRKTTGGLNGLV
jgi:hypothetical protein